MKREVFWKHLDMKLFRTQIVVGSSLMSTYSMINIKLTPRSAVPTQCSTSVENYLARQGIFYLIRVLPVCRVT